MSEPQPPEKGDGKPAADEDDDQANRTVENLVLAGFFVVVVATGIWLLSTMADVRKTTDCVAQGRRNCQPIEVPERPR
jgi:hypothetical protein